MFENVAMLSFKLLSSTFPNFILDQPFFLWGKKKRLKLTLLLVEVRVTLSAAQSGEESLYTDWVCLKPVSLFSKLSWRK